MNGRDRYRKSVFTQCVMADILIKANFRNPGVPETMNLVPAPIDGGTVFSDGLAARLPSGLNKLGGVKS